MKQTISLVLVLTLSLASASLAAEDTWTRKADMPTARWGLSTSVVEGKIYAIGGGQSPYGTYLSLVEEYDPATDTWTRKADMPTGRAFADASVVDRKVYVVGGSPRNDSSTSSMEAYDPATDTWTRKMNMPTTRTFLSTSVVNGKIYAIGGIMFPGGLVSTVEEYDPATDTWTRKADMLKAKCGLSTSVVDGKIYAIGGITGGNMTGPGLLTVEKYDPATDTWTQKSDMPTARGYLSTSVVNGKIYAIGGTPGSWGEMLSTVEEYDPVTDTWTTKSDMLTARCMHPTSVVDWNIYAIGGTVQYWPWTPTSTVEVYEIGFISADFNRDGVVDCADICIMVDHWGENYPLCDIAPPPFGDGIVDVQDLIVLAEHLFEGIPPFEPEEVNVDEKDNGSQVELEQGQILVVTLESNPSTGYRWEQAENQESILEQMGEAEFKPSETGEPPLVGAGGWEIFRFKAISEGKMTLQLVYHRPWEEGVEPLNTFSIQVVVN